MGIGKDGLDGFVNIGNEIAHRGRKAGKYIKFSEAKKYRSDI